MNTITKCIALAMLIACASGVYYSKADVCNCLPNKQCEGLNLAYCDLTYKSLTEGKFRLANLHGENLTGTDFSEANLTGADLTDTIIQDTNFSKAMLMDAQFKGALIKSANFNYANLKGAKISFATLKNLYNAGTLKGAIWPEGICMDHRCGGDVLNKNTVILSSIDNQSDKDYIIVTTDAPLDELLAEIDKSKEETSQFKDWFMPKYGIQTFYGWFSDTSKNMYGDEHSFTFSTDKKYSFRICGDFMDDAPLIAKAHTLSTYPIPGSNNTFPDLSSKGSPTGTTTQTIILLPIGFQYQCNYVHLIGRSDNNFTVYTYATYNSTNGCGNTKDAPAVKAPRKSPSPLELGQAGKLSVVINDKRIPTSITATKV